ncbi:MAG: hypothetical protein ACHQSE_11970 [Gemmatimonadales bacterium]
MSVTGVNNSLRDLLATRIDQTIGRPLDHQSQTGTAPSAATGKGASAAAQSAAKSASKSALTPQAPEGTDPALWSILTGEERAYFANNSASGPLTYSKVMMPNRSASSALPAVRGGRVDVRA